IPAWAHSGGVDSMLQRLADPASRARIRAELVAAPRSTDRFIRAAGGPSCVIVLPFADSLKQYTGKRLSEVAALRHEDPYETLFNLVTAERARTGGIYFLMSEPDVRVALQTWWTGFDTDFGGVAPDGPFGRAGAHPRTAGGCAGRATCPGRAAASDARPARPRLDPGRDSLHHRRWRRDPLPERRPDETGPNVDVYEE